MRRSASSSGWRSKASVGAGQPANSLPVGSFGVMHLDLQHGEEAVKCVRRRDRLFQRTSLAESNYVFWGVLETNAVCGTVSAQDFHSRSSQIGLQTDNIKFFSASGL